MSLSWVQRLLTNPIGVALDKVLAFHGPQQLEQWIADHTAMADLIPLDGLTASVRAHPVLLKIGGGAIDHALEGWDPDMAAATLTVMHGVAPAVARETAPPALQPQMVEALRTMCTRLGQPDAFPWFCQQCGTISRQVQTVLRENPRFGAAERALKT